MTRALQTVLFANLKITEARKLIFDWKRKPWFKLVIQSEAMSAPNTSMPSTRELQSHRALAPWISIAEISLCLSSLERQRE